MRRVAEPVIFAAVFAVATAVLGGLLWRATTGQLAPLRNAMTLAPALSAIIAARGFGWRRKRVYGALTLGGYFALGVVALASGIHAVAATELSTAASSPSALTTLYLAVITTYPFVMLMLFVGRRPARLWSR